MRTITILLIVLVPCISVSHGAQVVFNTFGPGDSYNQVGGALGGGLEWAQSFVSNDSGYLSDIWIGVIQSNDPDPSTIDLLQVWVASDSPSGPASTLESFETGNIPLPNASGTPPPPVHFSAADTTWIEAGTQYWLAATISGDATGGWGFMDAGVPYNGEYGFRDTTATQNWTVPSSPYISGTDGAFRVAVTVVPEPISLLLFIAGGTLLAGRSYMKRKNRA